MERENFIALMGQIPTGIRDSEALLMIKALVWDEVLESLLNDITLEETNLSQLQTDLLRLNKDKKKCMKSMLELSLKAQSGDQDAQKKIEGQMSELDDLNTEIENHEYERDLIPARIRRIDEQFVLSLFERLYKTLDESMTIHRQVILDIETMRQAIKEKWAQKFELDELMKSLNTFTHTVLNKDQIDELDQVYLKGRTK